MGKSYSSISCLAKNKDIEILEYWRDVIRSLVNSLTSTGGRNLKNKISPALRPFEMTSVS